MRHLRVLALLAVWWFGVAAACLPEPRVSFPARWWWYTYGRVYQGAVERCSRGEWSKADCRELARLAPQIDAQASEGRQLDQKTLDLLLRIAGGAVPLILP